MTECTDIALSDLVSNYTRNTEKIFRIYTRHRRFDFLYSIPHIIDFKCYIILSI